MSKDRLIKGTFNRHNTSDKVKRQMFGGGVNNAGFNPTAKPQTPGGTMCPRCGGSHRSGTICPETTAKSIFRSFYINDIEKAKKVGPPKPPGPPEDVPPQKPPVTRTRKPRATKTPPNQGSFNFQAQNNGEPTKAGTINQRGVRKPGGGILSRLFDPAKPADKPTPRPMAARVKKVMQGLSGNPAAPAQPQTTRTESKYSRPVFTVAEQSKFNTRYGAEPPRPSTKAGHKPPGVTAGLMQAAPAAIANAPARPPMPQLTPTKSNNEPTRPNFSELVSRVRRNALNGRTEEQVRGTKPASSAPAQAQPSGPSKTDNIITQAKARAQASRAQKPQVEQEFTGTKLPNVKTNEFRSSPGSTRLSAPRQTSPVAQTPSYSATPRRNPTAFRSDAMPIVQQAPNVLDQQKQITQPNIGQRPAAPQLTGQPTTQTPPASRREYWEKPEVPARVAPTKKSPMHPNIKHELVTQALKQELRPNAPATAPGTNAPALPQHGAPLEPQPISGKNTEYSQFRSAPAKPNIPQLRPTQAKPAQPQQTNLNTIAQYNPSAGSVRSSFGNNPETQPRPTLDQLGAQQNLVVPGSYKPQAKPAFTAVPAPTQAAPVPINPAQGAQNTPTTAQPVQAQPTPQPTPQTPVESHAGSPEAAAQTKVTGTQQEVDKNSAAGGANPSPSGPKKYGGGETGYSGKTKEGKDIKGKFLSYFGEKPNFHYDATGHATQLNPMQMKDTGHTLGSNLFTPGAAAFQAANVGFNQLLNLKNTLREGARAVVHPIARVASPNYNADDKAAYAKKLQQVQAEQDRALANSVNSDVTAPAEQAQPATQTQPANNPTQPVQAQPEQQVAPTQEQTKEIPKPKPAKRKITPKKKVESAPAQEQAKPTPAQPAQAQAQPEQQTTAAPEEGTKQAFLANLRGKASEAPAQEKETPKSKPTYNDYMSVTEPPQRYRDKYKSASDAHIRKRWAEAEPSERLAELGEFETWGKSLRFGPTLWIRG